MKAERTERAEKVKGWGIVREIMSMVLLLASSSSMEAQINSGSQWIVGGGAGAVIRSVHQGSFGLNFQVARVLQPAPAFYLESGIIWQGYKRSPRGNDLCPDEGCPPPLENALSIVGPEVRASYREPESNPVFPVAGIGLFRVSSQDTSGIRFGASAGLAISLRRSGVGPALDFRYFHVFGDSRFRSVIPIALRWSF